MSLSLVEVLLLQTHFHYSNAELMNFWNKLPDESRDIDDLCSVLEFKKSSIDAAYERAHRLIDDFQQHGIIPILKNDPRFPTRLHSFNHAKGEEPPVCIYVKGSDTAIAKLNHRSVAIVGTRHPSTWAYRRGVDIAARLAERGFNIVSGLALGCDSAAHNGAISVDGTTIAVLGYSLDKAIYPSINKNLANQILQNDGLLLTEYPVDVAPCGETLRARNRFQVALSEGTIVIEGSIKSGTAKTVRDTVINKKPLAVLEIPPSYSDATLNHDIMEHPRKYGSNVTIIHADNEQSVMFTSTWLVDSYKEERKMPKRNWKLRDLVSEIQPNTLSAYPTIDGTWAGQSDFILNLCLARGTLPSFTPITNDTIPLLQMKSYYAPAVSMIVDAIRAGTPICICQDYDCDGITAGSSLLSCLKTCGADVTWVMPDRDRHGYGLNVALVMAHAKPNSLLITVDNGISNVDEVHSLQQSGYKVIITDHHLPKDQLPPAELIVNPKLGPDDDDEYMVPGVWVAAKLGLAVLEQFHDRSTEEYRRVLSHCCALVTLGIISDVIDLNPTVIKQLRIGLMELRTTTHAGIRFLFGYKPLMHPSQCITTKHIGFVKTPRINAVSRLGKAELGMELLSVDSRLRDLTDDEYYHLRSVTADIFDCNADRKRITTGVFIEVQRMVDEQLKSNPELHSIVLHDASWPVGVIGIAASRLVERYQVPVILFTTTAKDPNLYIGSGRGVENFDLFDTLGACSSALDHYGGHKVAAGVAVSADRFTEFTQMFDEKCKQILSELPPPSLVVDAKARIGDLLDIYWQMFMYNLEPTGNGHPFLNIEIDHVSVENVNINGVNHYLTLVDPDTNASLSVNRYVPDESDESTKWYGDIVDVVVSPEIHVNTDRLAITYQLVDIRKAQ